MKLVIGLGNPGRKYQNNRHNVGYWVVDALRTKAKKNLLVKKTNVFMNESGEAIKHLLSKHPNISLSDLYIVHDDLDIPLGQYKIQFGKGPKDHKGLNSIYEALDTKDFWHVRIGVDNREPDNRISGEEYVLNDFTQEEQVVIKKVIKRLTSELAFRE